MGRRRIETKDFVRDVRAGTSDSDLKKKYGLSQKVLDDVLSRLVKSGQLEPSALMRDVSQSFESTLVVATTCPRCGGLLWADSGECSNCLANRISESIDDEERASTEVTETAAQFPENQVPGHTDAAPVVELTDGPVTEEEFTFSDAGEGVMPEPADTVVVSEETAESVEIEGFKEIENRAIKKRRWPVIAAMTIFGVAVSLGALVFTEVLDLPGMFRTNPAPQAPPTKPQATAASQDAAAVPSAAKQPESDRDPLAPGKRRGAELQMAAEDKSTEPQAQRENILAPQTVPADERNTLPGPAVPGRTAAAAPQPESTEATGEAPSSAELTKKSDDSPVTDLDLNTALLKAVEEGRVERVIVLLDRGADVNALDTEGSPLLTVAAKLGHASVVDLLLKRGADASMKDKSDLTALARACEAGNERIVELLLIHDKSKGAADLLGACEKGKTKVVELMLDRGADINARSSDGGTPLMIAANKGHLELVEILLTKGADATAQDNKGFTALAWAYTPTAMNVTPFRVQREIIRLLKHHEVRKADVPASHE